MFFPEAEARADLAACRALLRHGSRSFFAASLVLPRRVREPASALYAFCRLADDAVDLAPDPRAGLDALRHRLAAAYAGRPLDHPVDRAFAAVVERFGLPRALPEALFEGFAWDAEGRRYDSLGDLEAYAVRVAGTVGMMMSVLMDRREPAVLARACDLGAAMQLTNIARDVGEDARAGRLYLPQNWLRAAGLAPEALLRAPVPSPALAAVVGDLLDAADGLYRRAAAGIDRLPADCRPAIRAAGAIYAEIGLSIRRHGCDSVTRRAVVPSHRKAWLVAAAFAPRPAGSAARDAAALAPARELVLAAAATARSPGVGRRARLGDRVAGVFDLFARLERDDLARRAVRTPRPEASRWTDMPA